jgi:hypothetical protein
MRPSATTTSAPRTLSIERPPVRVSRTHAAQQSARHSCIPDDASRDREVMSLSCGVEIG